MFQNRQLVRLLHTAPILLLVALVGAEVVGNRHASKQRESVGNATAAQGEQAIARLKQDHTYDSLQEAVAAARYRVYADEKASQAFYANNAAQHLSAYFLPDAARITVKTNGAPDSLDGAVERTTSQEPLSDGPSQLTLRFIGAGYGDTIQQAQGQPAITTTANRLTYTHALKGHHNQGSQWFSPFSNSFLTSDSSHIEEWYINRAEGIEHGFTLSSPVAERVEGERLKLELELDGSFIAEVNEEGHAISFKSKDGDCRLNYAGLKVIDAGGRELAARMSINEATLSFEIDDLNASYPITVDPSFIYQQSLLVQNNFSGFGYSVAISGDTAVVGAPDDDIGVNHNQGSAFVFILSGDGSWVNDFKLISNLGHPGDLFGTSVAISGDTLFVGAYGDNDFEGAVYVFVPGGCRGCWQQLEQLYDLDLPQGSYFGKSVSVDGDVAVVGAPRYLSSGAAFVYTRSGTFWTTQPRVLLPSSGQTVDEFGDSVAIRGDTVVVGAPLTTYNSTSRVGSAYVFTGSGVSWSQQAEFILPNATADFFGQSVATTNSSGSKTVVIGSPRDGSDWKGAAYVYSNSGAGWGTPQKVVASDGAANNQFGYAVAVDHDTLVVGARGTSPYSIPGFAYIYNKLGFLGWIQQAKLIATDGATGDQFGSAVAISGATIFAGAFTDVDQYGGGGSAYVFTGFGSTWPQLQKSVQHDAHAGDFFGSAIALSGDRAVIGVPDYDVDNALNQGLALIFKRVGVTWSQEAELIANDGKAGDLFGSAVDIDGDYVVVGAPGDDIGSPPHGGQGSAYVFVHQNGWAQQAKLIANDGAAIDSFGTSVAIATDTNTQLASLEKYVFVGAPLANIGANADQGAVYEFRSFVSGIWAQSLKVTDSGGSAGDQFGYSVSADATALIVGAPLDDVNANADQGSATIFWSPPLLSSSQKVAANDGAANDQFGHSVSISNDAAVVGAYHDDVGANADQGSAYVFTRPILTGATWSQAQKLTASDGAAGDSFGNAVAIDKDTIIVGAFADTINAAYPGEGSAYVFLRSGALWSQRTQLTASNHTTVDAFGTAVAVDDRTFIIGAPGFDFQGENNYGIAYVFDYEPGRITNQWQGSISSDWHVGANWSNGFVPTSLDDALLPASGVSNEAVVFSQPFTSIHDLTIAAGRQLTINAGQTLIVNGDLTVDGIINGGGALIFSGASLINNNTINVASVVFNSGEKTLSGTGIFFTNNTVQLTPTTDLTLTSSHTMNVLSMNGGDVIVNPLRTLSLQGAGSVLPTAGNFKSTPAGQFGNVSLDGAAPQTIGGSGQVDFQNVTINNPAVSLGISCGLHGVLDLKNNDLITGTNYVITYPDSTTQHFLGSGDVVGNVLISSLGLGASTDFSNPSNQYRNTTGTPYVSLTINLVRQAPNDFPDAVRRTYTITQYGSGTFLGDLQLHYKDAELNGNAENSTLDLWKNDGSGWVNAGGNLRDFTANWVKLSGVQVVAPGQTWRWVIAGPTGPTAVEFAGAQATQFDDGVLVEWQTGFEVANLGFNLYRDDGGRRVLTNSGLIAGSALVAGPATLMTAGRSYAWFDKHPASQSACYFLEDIDTNGESTWHGPVCSTRVDGPSPANKPGQARMLSVLSKSAEQERYASKPVETTATPTTGGKISSVLQKAIASGDGVKLAVKDEGWYRITRNELEGAGLAPNADLTNLQLFVDGVEQPLLIVANPPDSSDSFEAIEFYGIGSDSPYSALRTYYLIAGSQPGRRIPVINTRPDSRGAESFPFTVERKERSVYFSALLNGEAENWFGPVVTSQSVEQAVTVRALDQAAPTRAELQISLQGVTELAASPDHQVDVQLNHQNIGRLVFDGREHKTERFVVPASSLREGDNLITLSGSGPTDVSLVDSIRLTYPRRYTADDDVLKLSAAEGRTSQRVDGFTSKQIRIFDVSDPKEVRELTGVIEPTVEGRYAVTANAELPDRTLLALTAAQFKKPVSVSANRPSSLANADNQADFLIITRRNWFDALEPLKARRDKQGLLTMLVDVEDIFDEFSFGQKTPYAVRDFLRVAAQNWSRKPRFVLMAGDASLDPRNYTGLGETDFLPTRLLDTALMETASDDWLADFDGDGLAELAVGRLPIRTEKEAADAVNKILRYEAANPSGELVLFADLNDGFDFETASSKLRVLAPRSVRVQEIFRSRNNDATTKAMLLEAIKNGPKVVNYSGHGSVTNWRGNILTTGDARGLANGDGLALFVMMDCLNGYFQDPMNESLAEALMRNEQGGAIAVWGSSGMTLPYEQSLINQQLYSTLFGKTNLTLGEHVGFAKLAAADPDVRRTWILFGDPTLRLK